MKIKHSKLTYFVFTPTVSRRKFSRRKSIKYAIVHLIQANNSIYPLMQDVLSPHKHSHHLDADGEDADNLQMPMK